MNKITFISLYIFIFLCSFHFKVSSSYFTVTYYVDSKSTNNNSLTCGVEIDNACASIAAAIQAYNQSDTNIPLIIELAEGLYLPDGNTQLEPIGTNITIQPQPNANVTLNFGLLSLISIYNDIINNYDTTISIKSLQFVNTPTVVFVFTETLNVSISVDNCTFSNTMGIGDVSKFVFDIGKLSNTDKILEVDIRNSIFSSLAGGVLYSFIANSSITNTLITNTRASTVIQVYNGTLNLSGIRYISNTANGHINPFNVFTSVSIYDSIFENNKYLEEGYGQIINVESPVHNLFINNTSFNNNRGVNTLILDTAQNSTIRNCNFTNNLAVTNYSYLSDISGVVFYLSPKNSTISNCLFSNNTTPINIIQSLSNTKGESFHMDNSRFENNIFQNISIATDINFNQLNAIIENTIFNENQKINAITCSNGNLIVNSNRFIGNSQEKSICKSQTCTINGMKCGSKLNGGQIAGIVVGSILFVAIIVIILIVIYKKRQNPKRLNAKNKYNMINS